MSSFVNGEGFYWLPPVGIYLTCLLDTGPHYPSDHDSGLTKQTHSEQSVQTEIDHRTLNPESYLFYLRVRLKALSLNIAISA